MEAGRETKRAEGDACDDVELMMMMMMMMTLE